MIAVTKTVTMHQFHYPFWCRYCTRIIFIIIIIFSLLLLLLLLLLNRTQSTVKKIIS